LASSGDITPPTQWATSVSMSRLGIEGWSDRGVSLMNRDMSGSTAMSCLMSVAAGTPAHCDLARTWARYPGDRPAHRAGAVDGVAGAAPPPQATRQRCL